MKNLFEFRGWQSASIRLTLRVAVAALVGFFGLICLLSVVARLDVAFFEANGMIRSEELRGAFYLQIFQVDLSIVAMVAGGFVSLAVLTFLFSKSQFDYISRLHLAFAHFEKVERPLNADELRDLGPLRHTAEHFFKILSLRLKHEGETSVDAALKEALVEWPKSPQISWLDQLQFSLVLGSVAAFFGASCVSFYLKVSDRVTELAGHMIRFSSPQGPSFLAEQFELTSLLVGIILTLVISVAGVFGFNFSRQMAEADYAMSRDLASFMKGDFKHRIHLRIGDPARDLLPPLNAILARLQAKLEGKSPGAES
jgi:hypothetical protein